jgi:hypothetical protein
MYVKEGSIIPMQSITAPNPNDQRSERAHPALVVITSLPFHVVLCRFPESESRVILEIERGSLEMLASRREEKKNNIREAVRRRNGAPT